MSPPPPEHDGKSLPAPPRHPKGVDQTTWKEAWEGLHTGQGLSWFLELAERSARSHKAVAGVLDLTVALKLKKTLHSAVDRDLPPDTSSSRLLRLFAGREEEARRRTNPIPRNEAFQCEQCGAEVPALQGGGVRNHCPRCLYSKHVDGAVPGDRASACGGMMTPGDMERLAGLFRVTHRCLRCGFTRKNRLYPDRLIAPDQLDALLPGDNEAGRAGD